MNVGIKHEKIIKNYHKIRKKLLKIKNTLIIKKYYMNYEFFPFLLILPILMIISKGYLFVSFVLTGFVFV